MQGLCLVADAALCFWKGFFRQKGLWGGLGTIQRRSRALFYTHFKPAMAVEDVTTLCLLCPMLESRPAEENEFAVASFQHVASYRNTITLILCYNGRDWSWRYFPLFPPPLTFCWSAQRIGRAMNHMNLWSPPVLFIHHTSHASFHYPKLYSIYLLLI